MQYRVTEKAMRPAKTDEACFYCGAPVEGCHQADCVLIKKRVKVRAIIEYEVSVPAHWDGDTVEFHRNDGTWCSDNMLAELEELITEEKCLCNFTRFEYIEDAPNSIYLDE